MNDRISQALTKLFDRYRIVFWYDAKQELRDDYEALLLNGVEKLEIRNNEYGIKYRILREQPEQKFLLYHEGRQPDDLDNWLLDVQLAHGEFRTDQVAIWLSELELGLQFAEVVQQHIEFFNAAKRKDGLKKLLETDDTAGQIRLKMLAVCADSEPRLDSVLELLLEELSVSSDQYSVDNSGKKFKLIQRCNLEAWLWEQMKRHYGYESTEPGIRDFVVKLFKECYFQNFTDYWPLTTNHLTSDALVFLKRWKDSRRFEGCFEALSSECSDVIGIEHDLAKRDIPELIELDYFRLIDQKIISNLVRAVATRTVSAGDVALWVRHRRQGHWYHEFSHLYEAIDYAAQFIEKLSVFSHQFSAGELATEHHLLTTWLQRYAESWYQVDFLYRKCIYHVQMSAQASLMATLSEQIENLYTNNYLLKLGDEAQSRVDKLSKWEAFPIRNQCEFFEHWVRPFLRKDNKVCVIISDAMRYEIGEELLTLIRQEDRYSAEIAPMLSMLPSYTQLGMAALLPGKDLSVVENGTVLVDGQSSQGTANRTKILQTALNGGGKAIVAEDFMAMNRDDSRALLKENQVLYIYHNRIDHTGDKIHSEGQAFEAAEQTLADLLKLVKKLTAANANNLLITADHGFIYQHRELDESDFLSVEPKGDEILYRDRRFILGKNLQTSSAFHHFSASQLGLSGDIEVQIPKSINRLRLKGSGSRFVHGGASLQEIVIPVIKVNKKRQSDVSAVEVDILRGASSVITSGQLAVTLYQTGPVTDKVQPRLLQAGIFTEAGELISDSHELTFDLSSDNPRERELQVRFVLTRKADQVNGQEVILRLQEKHAGTSHYKEYKSLRYLIRRSFTSDFDF